MNVMRLRAALFAAVLACAAPAHAATPAPIVIPTGDDVAAWKAQPADGVSLSLSSDAGTTGKALRLDFDFHGGGGYAVAHRAVSLDLPENYRFTFRVRGNCPNENLEFKLADASGDNVWWCNQRDVTFSPAGVEMKLKKRHISFAWGPLGGGEAKHVAAIEFAITAGKGGKGTVWIENLRMEPLPKPDTTWREVVSGAWSSRRGEREPALVMDLGAAREFGGLVIDWAAGRHARDYAVELSVDRRTWTAARMVSGSNGGRDYLYLPESEARWIRVRGTRLEADAMAVTAVRLQKLEWSATPDRFYSAIAKDAPRGRYPRGMLGENIFWTVVGQDFDSDEGLIDEVGRIEAGRGQWTVEPFVRSGGKLVTWADVTATPSLRRGDLPIPSVEWAFGDERLTVTAFGAGVAEHSALVARYRLTNRSAAPRRDTLYLAIRPFQVNPPTQFLSTQGGVAPIRELAADGNVVRVNGDRGLTSVQAPDAFGAASFDQGDVVEFLADGRLPAAVRMPDAMSHASGALAYALDLPAGGTREIDLVIPLHDAPNPIPIRGTAADELRYVDQLDSLATSAWRTRLDRVGIEFPDSDAVHALKAQLAYVLINRNGPRIQPGTRSYARSWIRDGCLTSSALLRLGETEAVKQFIEWFAPFQFANGKAPCCVDSRGADPVPEHDSSGELIYLIAEYTRYTGDMQFAEKMWPHVLAAEQYLDTLRAQRRTPEWQTPENARFFGLLPPSISHEGYSSKPMHSYWDDFFALRGFKDAAWLAKQLHKPEQPSIEHDRDEFSTDFANSIRRTMAEKHIDYIPGCADLGDFDPTSTSIAFDPVMADTSVVPRKVLEATYEKYWDFFTNRANGTKPWENFTPYEWRNVGAMAHLAVQDQPAVVWADWTARANAARSWLMNFRRPAGFQHWAEVVWHDERAPHFIGDMPHTWCGTDYVRSILDMLAYEDEGDSSLVIGAGIPPSWLADSGVVVKDLRTRWGPLSYRIRMVADSTAHLRNSRNYNWLSNIPVSAPSDKAILVDIDDTGLRIPPAGIRIALSLGARQPLSGPSVIERVGGRHANQQSSLDSGMQALSVRHALPVSLSWRVRPVSTPYRGLVEFRVLPVSQRIGAPEPKRSGRPAKQHLK